MKPSLYEQLTYHSFHTLNAIDFSEPGSNNRAAEDETVFAWECCMQRCEGLLLRSRTIICNWYPSI